jgi:hypothetical protein
MSGPEPRRLFRGNALREVSHRLDVFVPLNPDGSPNRSLAPVLIRCGACAESTTRLPGVEAGLLGFAAWDDLLLPGGDGQLPHLYRFETRASPAVLRTQDGRPVERPAVSLNPRTLAGSERLTGTQRWTCRACHAAQDYKTETVRARTVKAKTLGMDTAWLPLQRRRR